MRPHPRDAFNIEHGMEQTSMANAIKKRLDRKGFTLAEVLVTVAIIIILAGVTFVSVVQYQKNLRLMEMDGTAKEIFIAAQNHLSVAQASGDLDRLAEKAKSASGTTIGTKLDAGAVSVSAYAGNDDGEYYSVIHNVASGSESYIPTEGKQILQMLLPFGALDETVATSGNYAIVYELKSASVVAVLYSGAGNASFGNAAVINFSDEDVKAIPKLYNDKAKRKSYEKEGVTAIVGCYTGTAGSAAIPTETLEAPKLEVRNENQLHVLVSDKNTKDIVTLIIRGVQSGTVAKRILERSTSDGNTGSGTFDVTLDDITGDGSYRFANIISSNRFTKTEGDEFIPGENIEISARVSSTTGLATPKESAKYTVSSLFGDANETKDAAGNTTVYIKNLRHLENLGANVSGFTAALGKNATSGNAKVVNIIAEQKNDITMFSMGTSGSSSGNCFENLRGSTIYGMEQEATFAAIDVNYPLVYHGNQHEIHDVSIGAQNGHTAAGIFGKVTDPESSSVDAALSVSDLILRNDRVSGTNVQNAGILVGEMAQNLTVDGVLAYYHEDTYDETKDSSIEVAASQNAGGLIGLVAGGKLEVKNSAAAVYVKGGSAAGGFIGSVTGAETGSTIVQSYAGGHTKDGAYSTTDATTKQPVLEGSGRYNVQATQASGYAGGFIGVTTDQVSMNAVYSTTSAYSDNAANSGSFSGNMKANFGTANNYYAIGPHNGTDASTDDAAKAEIQTGQAHRQATPYDRKLILKTSETEHKTMDKTSYPLCTVRNLCEGDASIKDTDLPWFIKEHVGDWVVTKKTKESVFEVENGNRLTVRFNTGLDEIAEDLYYEVKVHGQTRGNVAYFRLHIKPDGIVDVQRRFNTDGFQEYNHNIATIKQDATPKKVELYLDDITNPYGNFASIFDGNYFYPGEDISINVTALTSNNDAGAVYDEDKKLYTNSLYGYLQNAGVDASEHNQQKIEAVKKYVSTAGTEENGLGLIKTGDQYYVQIDNSRHLQNLSENVGSLLSQDIGYRIAGAIQTDNIYWAGSSEGRAHTIGFQEELGEDLSVYSKDNQLTQDGLFYPIATYNTLLSLYDGSGYRISGLASVKNANQSAVALFVQPKGEMTIKNLTLENVLFSITGSESRAAGLIGYADHPVTIDNVHFVGALRVKGSDITGGFVPQVNGKVTIKNSGIEGDTTVISDTGEAGGLIGHVCGHNTTVVNAKVVGKNTEIIAGKNAGGLIGNIENCPTLSISNVGVSAFVASNGKEDQAGAGGLIGRIGEVGADSKIEKSYYGGRTTDGIYGSCTVNERTKHEHTYDANINGEKSTGGFIGYIGKANGLSIENCFSTGSVYAKSEAAGGFIGYSLGWSQGGSISIKNCYSMGKVSGTNSSKKGGFIGKSNGTSTFENVFYYSAFNTVKDPVGNNPGFRDIKVINAPENILATDDSKTVNTHVYDTPILGGEAYPYKNWTTEHDDTSITMVPTYYGDWPKVPERRLKGYIAYYEVYGKDSIGVYVPGVDTKSPLVKKPTMDLNGQKTGYGILINTKYKDVAENYFITSSGSKLAPLTENISKYESGQEYDYSVTLPDGDTYYLWRPTGDYESALIPANISYGQAIPAAVRVYHLEDGKRIDEVEVNARYGAAIAPAGKLGSAVYPFRIRNDRHRANYYSTESKLNDEHSQQYSNYYFVDDQKGTGPFTNKVN